MASRTFTSDYMKSCECLKLQRRERDILWLSYDIFLCVCGRVLSCLVLFCLVLSLIFLSCLVLSVFILPCLVLSCLVVSCLVSSGLVLYFLSRLVSSYLVLSRSVVSCRQLVPHFLLSFLWFAAAITRGRSSAFFKKRALRILASDPPSSSSSFWSSIRPTAFSSGQGLGLVGL